MEHAAPASPSLSATSPSAAALAQGGAADAPEVYGLEELLALAGERLREEITPRTVRLYATQGLIDRPGREGRSAIYGRRHLLQLLLIRSLARRGLSLAAIAPLIGLADGELERQLHQLEGDGSPVSSLLAAMATDSQATHSPTTDRQTADRPTADRPTADRPTTASQVAAPGASQAPPVGDANAGPPERHEALDYLQSLQSSVSPEAASAGVAADSLERSASLLPLLGSPLSSRPSSRPSSRSASRSPSRSGGSREAASRWHRFTLAPGVELQISDSVAIPPPGSRRMAWLNRLVARLLEQLEDSPP